VIARCSAADVPRIHALINEAAQAYRGVIPADQWHEPYMPLEELEAELAAGVRFWVHGEFDGVMGLQDVKDVSLIRHAYTLTRMQGQGIGSALLEHLKRQTERAMLVGTWKAATWAVRFYQGRGFRLVGDDEKSRLLKKYWTISERQVDESVVLVLG
jgi:GNAT superfamily N-acetyltransferase